jgi:hypothetical protein
MVQVGIGGGWPTWVGMNLEVVSRRCITLLIKILTTLLFPHDDACVRARAVARVQVEMANSTNAAGHPFVLSTIWAWDCPSHGDNLGCVTPGRSSGDDAVVEALKNANAKLAAPTL